MTTCCGIKLWVVYTYALSKTCFHSFELWVTLYMNVRFMIRYRSVNWRCISFIVILTWYIQYDYLGRAGKLCFLTSYVSIKSTTCGYMTFMLTCVLEKHIRIRHASFKLRIAGRLSLKNHQFQAMRLNDDQC